VLSPGIYSLFELFYGGSWCAVMSLVGIVVYYPSGGYSDACLRSLWSPNSADGHSIKDECLFMESKFKIFLTRYFL